MGLLSLCGLSRPKRTSDEERADAQRELKHSLARRALRRAMRRRSSRVTPAPPSGVESCLIVIGCDNAGKSTLIAALRGKTLEDPSPTVGFDANKTVYHTRTYDTAGLNCTLVPAAPSAGNPRVQDWAR